MNIRAVYLISPDSNTSFFVSSEFCLIFVHLFFRITIVKNFEEFWVDQTIRIESVPIEIPTDLRYEVSTLLATIGKKGCECESLNWILQ